jgi:hypothetical protein
MKQGLICILDILGTKGIWSELNIEKYFDGVRQAEEELLKLKKRVIEFPDQIPFELDFLSFSDTLVVTLVKTIDDEENDPYLFYELIPGFSQLILGIFQSYFAGNFFLRGAISFGQIEKRGSHFVGQAVDDAAEYFELPDMIGVCLTPKATMAMDYAIDWNTKFNNVKADAFVVKYKTPLKTKQIVDLYQIDWVKHFVELAKGNPGISPINSLRSFLCQRNVPSVALSKFTNTLQFFETLSNNYS